jgi:predicted metalloprotease with PDZ domain
MPSNRLDATAFAAGHFHREPPEASAGFSALWGGEPPFDPRPLMQWTGKLHKWMSGFFKDTEEPPYRVILRANPQNPGGGVAFFQAFVVGYGEGTTGERLKPIFGHEMTHTWTALGEDIGKWYNEGNAVYYQSLLPWRAGLISTDERLADINRTASRYYTNPRKDATEAYALEHFWEDTRVRVLPYDRGALYFAVLNGQILKASGGKRSIDDLIREMIGLYRSGAPMSEQVWVDMLHREIGEAAVATHRSMMSGGLMLPDSDAYGPCFQRTVKKIRPLDLGFDWGSLKSGVITGLKPDSEAAKAGLREGDKTTYRGPGDVDQQDVTRKITVRVVRDGQTIPITYLPRGEAVDAYQWERVPDAPESACKG